MGGLLLFLLWAAFGITGSLLVWKFVLDDDSMDLGDVYIMILLGSVFGPLVLLFFLVWHIIKLYLKATENLP